MLQQELSDKFKHAINREQAADTELIDSYLKLYLPKRLASLGMAVINLIVTNMRTGLGGKNLIELSLDPAFKNQNGDLEIDVGNLRTGDIVKLDRMAAGENTAVEGVIIKVKTSTITVSVEDSSDDEKIMALYNNTANENNRMWLAKLTNSITYKRMITTMNKLDELSEGDKNDIIKILLGESSYVSHESNKKLKFFNEYLNDSQKEAIDFAINKSNLTIIHGPPGTGKTYTIIEIIKQLAINQGEKVLVCGASNISVDTILERLSGVFSDDGDKKKKKKKDGLAATKLIRVGHPARLLEGNLKHSLEILSKVFGREILDDIDHDIGDTLSKIKKCKRYAERRQLWGELKALKKELRFREKKIVQELLIQSNVVLATLHGAGSRELTSCQDLRFDTIIIDEVSQSLEPQCWIPIINHLHFKRLIIAGDNMQLSPVIKDTNDSVMAQTLFDRLVQDLGGDQFKKLLNTQYRANDLIMRFSSEQLYHGKLKSDVTVANILLKDLKDVDTTDDTEVCSVWYDTQGGDFPEQIEGDEAESEINGSKYNQMEALVVKKHVHQLLQAKVPRESIGIISPYNAQVTLLKRTMYEEEEDRRIEISTIDGFQGREKEVIIISLVRSNEKREIGFLSDERRLNVALTRAKRHLCVIGDLELMGSCNNQFLNNLTTFVENNFDIRYPELGDY